MATIHETSLSVEVRRLRAMMLIRQFEDRVYVEYAMPRWQPTGTVQMKIGGFMHLCSGQEAIAVGVAEVFRRDVDRLVGGQRSHGHALALGVPPRRVMAELFGRVTGCCGGRSGSMTLADASVGYLGAFPVAGAQVPVGVGAAFACRYQRTGGCAFILFGDGALAQGAVYEALNLASLYRLPAVFLVENNGVALGTTVERHSADPDLVNRGRGYGMPCHGFDGNDIEQVVAHVGEAAARARAGGGPTYLVAHTNRLRGFAMTDPLKYRTAAQKWEFQAREPIRAYTARLSGLGVINDDELKRLVAEIAAIVEDAVQFAEASADPVIETRFDDVLAANYGSAAPVE